MVGWCRCGPTQWVVSVRSPLLADGQLDFRTIDLDEDSADWDPCAASFQLNVTSTLLGALAVAAAAAAAAAHRRVPT